MDKPVSISLHKLTTSVQAAVKAAAAKHPKFRQVPEPKEIAISNLIWGYPVPDGIIAQVTLAELQSYVQDVAAHIGQAGPEGAGVSLRSQQGGFVAFGRIIHCGIPPVSEFANVKA